MKLKIEIYGAVWCHACNDAKDYCSKKNLEYLYYDIDFPNNRDAVEKRMGREITQIPVIFVDDEYMLGGYGDLVSRITLSK